MENKEICRAFLQHVARVELSEALGCFTEDVICNTYHQLFTLCDGRIAAGKEYLDTEHLFETVFA